MSIKAGTRVTSSLLNSLEVLNQPLDKSSHTITNATPAQALTNSWSIPANDAAAGMVYRITFAGFGTWGSTQQQLNLTALLDGTTALAGTGSVAATEFSASSLLWFRGIVELCIVSIGSSGTFTAWLEYTVNVRAANLTGTAASNTITVVDGNSTSGATAAIDTTASHTFAAGAFWTATTGAPTITCTQSYIERLQAA